MSSSPFSSRTADSTPLLQVRDLHAGYGRAEVLHGLSLQAEPGSVVTAVSYTHLTLPTSDLV